MPTDVNPLLDAAADYLRFVTDFFEVISQSGSHIYHSAMQLAPRSSIVRKLYNQHIPSPVWKIVTGVPDLWDSCTASVGAATEVVHANWSPCGRFITVPQSFPLNRIEVRDSNTLEVVSALQPPAGDYYIYSGSLRAFSPDGCLLACGYRR